MSETLKIGESFTGWTPARKKQPDGTWASVAHLEGGNLLLSESKTVVDIIPRPEDERQAAELVRKLWEKIKIGKREQSVIDGKLYAQDNEAIGHRFDPGFFYIVEV